MTTIPVHEVVNNSLPAEEIHRRFAAEVVRGIKSVYWARDGFESVSVSTILNGAWRNIGYAARYGTPNDVYNYIYYTNQLIRAWFTYTMNDGKPVTLTVANRQIEVMGKFSDSRIGVNEVLEGIWTASVLRDKDSLAFYAQIPLEFTEKAGGMEDILFELILLFYQGLIKGLDHPNEAVEIHNRLIDLQDWEEYRKYIDDKFSEFEFRYMFKYRCWEVTYIFLPVLNIYYAVLANRQEEYEKAVHEALLKWREYYSMQYLEPNGEESNHTSYSSGYIALPILAACAFAYDRGMTLQTVSSEYIPEWLIKGDFTGTELLIKD